MIQLSADLGEGAQHDAEIWPLIDAANVACGGHTGDDRSMEAAVALASRHDVVLGAHPSYPDRENFGRRSLALEPSTLVASLVEQLRRLATIAAGQEVVLRHVKPHGALYNDAHRDRAVADVVVESILAVDSSLALVCGFLSQTARAAREAGIAVVAEAFGDRRYQSDGSLVPRSEPRSLLSVDEAAEQAELLYRESMVIAADGSRVPVKFDTLCIHSDMEGALDRLRAIRTRFGRG